MLRVFQTTCLVAIDTDELDDVVDIGSGRFNATDPVNLHQVNLEDVKNHLKDALIVDWNCEEYGNPIGLQSIEVDIEELQELTPEQVEQLYKKS